MNSQEGKRGRGKPPGSLKQGAKRQTVKIRLTDLELVTAKECAEIMEESVSEFIREAIRERCQKAR